MLFVALLFSVVVRLHGWDFQEIFAERSNEDKQIFEQHFYYDEEGRVFRKEGDRDPPDQPDTTDFWLAENFIVDDEGRIYPIADDFDKGPPFDAERDTVFRLYTKDNLDHEILKLDEEDSIVSSRFNVSHPTKFTIHGFQSSGDHPMNTVIRKQYFALGEFNVFVVDWSAGSGQDLASYFSVRQRVSAVGKAISRFIDKLVQATEVSLSEISLIGFSLGAHIAGNAGKAQSGRIKTIIGLDPAGPLFSEKDKDILSSQDAQYVEVLHTSVFGFSNPIGTSDFYANGGVFSQPGCFLTGDVGCSHGRAFYYFAESLTSESGFWAQKCSKVFEVNLFDVKCESLEGDPKETMGREPPNTENEVTGPYQFNTHSDAPFAQGQ
ncbi:phospholipase A1-like [Uranotaenia lowii]|uniref:phospholipase A1-like n=1 Tax=Uranotaenia lowii TaxID=190385 RepID=UPI00247A0FAF|nr:phospholipase A1-like [Uranotaenia lowii]